MASIAKATSVAQLLGAIISNGFVGVQPVEGGIAEGRVIFGRNKPFPVNRADGTTAEVYRLNTNIVHDMNGFRAAYAQFKATPFADVETARQAWYNLSDKFMVRANVWGDNPTLPFLQLDGAALGILNLEEYTDRDGVQNKAWTLNRVLGKEPKAMASVAFTLEDTAPTGTAGAAPSLTPPPVLVPAGGSAGLDPNQTRLYNGQAHTVASLRNSGWTDAQIEANTTTL